MERAIDIERLESKSYSRRLFDEITRINSDYVLEINREFLRGNGIKASHLNDERNLTLFNTIDNFLKHMQAVIDDQQKRIAELVDIAPHGKILDREMLEDM